MTTRFVQSAMRLSWLALAAGLMSCGAAMLLPAEARAACRGGFCVSGYDTGGSHVVQFTTTWKNVTHFNWVNPYNGHQYEMGGNQRQFIFANPPSGTRYQYAIQACNGGGFLQKSSCGPWAYFTHTAP